MRSKCEIHKIPKKGWGVFASQDLAKGEVIEISPVLPFDPEAELKNPPEEGFLWDHQLYWDGKKHDAVGLGYLMLYNHSEKPNVVMRRNLKSKTITVSARRNISAGEELVVHYRCDIWFKVIENE